MHTLRHGPLANNRKDSDSSDSVESFDSQNFESSSSSSYESKENVAPIRVTTIHEVAAEDEDEPRVLEPGNLTKIENSIENLLGKDASDLDVQSATSIMRSTQLEKLRAQIERIELDEASGSQDDHENPFKAMKLPSNAKA